jgi:hypothetical protein
MENNENIPSIQKRLWHDHWLTYTIISIIFIKVFGPLGGIVGIVIYFYLIKKSSFLIALMIGSVSGFASWYTLSVFMKNNL